MEGETAQALILRVFSIKCRIWACRWIRRILSPKHACHACVCQRVNDFFNFLCLRRSARHFYDFLLADGLGYLKGFAIKGLNISFFCSAATATYQQRRLWNCCAQGNWKVAKYFCFKSLEFHFSCTATCPEHATVWVNNFLSIGIYVPSTYFMISWLWK